MVELESIPDRTMNRAARFFTRITPYDEGFARGHTKLIKQKTEIFADYPYAQRLDTGWSKQFRGKGMTNPTISFIEAEVSRQVGRLK